MNRYRYLINVIVEATRDRTASELWFTWEAFNGSEHVVASLLNQDQFNYHVALCVDADFVKVSPTPFRKGKIDDLMVVRLTRGGHNELEQFRGDSSQAAR